MYMSVSLTFRHYSLMGHEIHELLRTLRARRAALDEAIAALERLEPPPRPPANVIAMPDPRTRGSA